MPIHTYWYNDDKTILIQKVSSPFTSADYIKSVDDVAAAVKDLAHLVDIILTSDEHHITLPANLLTSVRYASQRIPPNLGVVVVVRLNVMIEMMVEIAAKVFPRLGQHLQLANSFDEALEKIGKVRGGSLADQPAARPNRATDHPA